MNELTIMKRNASRFLLLAMLLIGAHVLASAQVQRPDAAYKPEIVVTRLVAAAPRPGNCEKLAFTIKNYGKRNSSPFTVEIQEIFYKEQKPPPTFEDPSIKYEVDEDRTKVLKTISIDSLAAGGSRSFEELEKFRKGSFRIFIKSTESSKKERSATAEKQCIQ